LNEIFDIVCKSFLRISCNFPIQEENRARPLTLLSHRNEFPARLAQLESKIPAFSAKPVLPGVCDAQNSRELQVPPKHPITQFPSTPILVLT
jgi:hypothetical protein